MTYGLPDDSRIKRKLRGAKTSETNILLACVIDKLGVIAQGLGAKKSKSVVDIYIEKPKEENDVQTFDTAEDFDRARANIVGGN